MPDLTLIMYGILQITLQHLLIMKKTKLSQVQLQLQVHISMEKLLLQICQVQVQSVVM